MPNLKTLSLDFIDADSVDLTRLLPAKGLRKLRLVNHGSCGEGLKALAGFAQLERLELEGISLHGIDLSPLTALENLSSLALDGCELVLEDIKALPDCCELTELTLRHNQFEVENLEFFRHFVGLESLDLRQNYRFDRSSVNISDFSSLRNLRRLWLSSKYDCEAGYRRGVLKYLPKATLFFDVD
ncbi:MAG: hypothetical protein P1V97_31045 [Planctomycetota bacterium]|nr:hypothetical protein [Planctomycetota bacterium]